MSVTPEEKKKPFFKLNYLNTPSSTKRDMMIQFLKKKDHKAKQGRPNLTSNEPQLKVQIFHLFN